MRAKTAILAAALILIAAGSARALVNAGGGWVEAWGQGTAFSACIAGHNCVETVKGTGAARTFFGSGPIGPYTFEASWTIYPPSTASDAAEACPGSKAASQFARRPAIRERSFSTSKVRIARSPPAVRRRRLPQPMSSTAPIRPADTLVPAGSAPSPHRRNRVRRSPTPSFRSVATCISFPCRLNPAAAQLGSAGIGQIAIGATSLRAKTVQQLYASTLSRLHWVSAQTLPRPFDLRSGKRKAP